MAHTFVVWNRYDPSLQSASNRLDGRMDTSQLRDLGYRLFFCFMDRIDAEVHN
jgi:hypothetical protein